MTIEQIEDLLPNGLHDAQIQALALDYEQMRLVLKVLVLVGLPDQPYPDCERYRAGEILFEGVQFCSVEYPQTVSAFQHPGALWFSYGRTSPEQIPAGVRDILPPGTQCYSLFIHKWLSHFHIAAAEVSFSWAGT